MVKNHEIASNLSDSAESAKRLLQTKRAKFAAGTVGLLATAGVLSACGPDGEPTSAPTTPTETSQPVETPSPTPTESEGYGPSGAERDQFIESIAIPVGEDATTTGKKIVENINLWANIGASDAAVEQFNRERFEDNSEVINMSLHEYAEIFTEGWKDEFATLFDEESESTPINLNNFTTVAANIMAGYLGTVNNGNAQATFTVTETFVSAEDLTATDGYDRTLEVTLHHSDNTGDTGVIDGENLEIDRVYIVDLNEIDGNLKIASLTPK